MLKISSHILLIGLIFCAPLYAIKHPTGFITHNECREQYMSVQFLLKESDFEQFVLSVPDGVVINQGGIVTADGKILYDTETYQQDQHRLLRGARNIEEEQMTFFEGRLAVISSPGQENWYHWLLQVLPRLKILVDAGIPYDKIYINDLQYTWQKQSLDIVLSQLNISPDRLLVVEGDSIIQAKTLIVPSVPFIQSKCVPLHGWLKDWIKACFLVSDESTNAPYLYISRANAKVRRVENENALQEMLESKGFKTLYLEELSIFDQARYINNAQIIIGPHGSGFTNLIFARPGTKVLEIDHGLEGEQRSCFSYIARSMECDYHPFYVDTVVEEQLEDDMFVDVKAFARFLDNQMRPQRGNKNADQEGYKTMKIFPKSFYFIRHGQTDWNKIHRLQGQIDIPLNEEGRNQALELQSLLHNLDIAHVYHSPLSRAHETMHIACKYLDVPKIPLDALKERHFGEWEGTEWDEVKKDTHMHVVPQNGESYAEFHERTLGAINSMLEASAGNVLFVAHAGTFRALCRVIDTHFAAVHNCQLFHFVAPDETDDQWRIYEL